jgi:hypothetical protein
MCPRARENARDAVVVAEARPSDRLERNRRCLDGLRLLGDRPMSHKAKALQVARLAFRAGPPPRSVL